VVDNASDDLIVGGRKSEAIVVFGRNGVCSKPRDRFDPITVEFCLTDIRSQLLGLASFLVTTSDKDVEPSFCQALQNRPLM
jgi:hypothetical protein